MTFSGRHVAVIGLAATGEAVARALSSRGARVTVYDDKPEALLLPERVAAIRSLPGVALSAGEDAFDAATVDLLVPSPGVPANARPLTEARQCGVPIWSEIEVAYRIAAAPILAITGTNGKTTTTVMLGAICRAAGRETIVCGNIAEDEGRRLPLIAAAEEARADAVLVAEISSFQLSWVQAFRPKVGAWLNLTPDHLDRYGSLDEYAADKARLFAAQGDGDVAVLNADDPIVMRFAAGRGAGRRVVFFGNTPTLPAVLDIMPDTLRVSGRHNFANAAAAAEMALAFGVAPAAIRDGLLGFTGVAHRMEPIGVVNGVRYINNSMCTNPAAVAASLESVEKPVVTIAGGRHKGGDLGALAHALAVYSKRVILIGEAATALADALFREGYRAIECAESLPAAVARAALQAREGDTVLLAPGCSSFDMFSSFEERGQTFREAVNRLS